MPASRCLIFTNVAALVALGGCSGMSIQGRNTAIGAGAAGGAAVGGVDGPSQCFPGFTAWAC